MWVCVELYMCERGALGIQRRHWSLLELEVQAVVSHCVGAGSHSLVPCKSSTHGHRAAQPCLFSCHSQPACCRFPCSCPGRPVVPSSSSVCSDVNFSVEGEGLFLWVRVWEHLFGISIKNDVSPRKDRCCPLVP